MIKSGIAHGLCGLIVLGAGVAAQAASVSFETVASSVQQARFDDVTYQPNIATPFSIEKRTVFRQVTFQPLVSGGNPLVSGRIRVAVYRDRGHLPAEQVGWLRNFSTRRITSGINQDGITLDSFLGMFDPIDLCPGDYWFALVGPMPSAPRPEEAPVIAPPETIAYGTGFDRNSNWFHGGRSGRTPPNAPPPDEPPAFPPGPPTPPPEFTPPPDVSPVPLPLSGLMLLSGLAALRFKRKRAPEGTRA